MQIDLHQGFVLSHKAVSTLHRICDMDRIGHKLCLRSLQHHEICLMLTACKWVFENHQLEDPVSGTSFRLHQNILS